MPLGPGVNVSERELKSLVWGSEEKDNKGTGLKEVRRLRLTMHLNS